MSKPNTSTATAAVTQLRQLVFYHLDNDLYDNALFMAERLYALDKGADSVHLLALCYVRMRKHRLAFDYSLTHGRSGKHLGCAYVFATACLALRKFATGVSALERVKSLSTSRNHWNRHSDCQRRHLPDAAAVQCLLGKLHRGRADFDRATDHFAEALKLNPFMWDAFQAICDMGKYVQCNKVFKLSPELYHHHPSSVANARTATVMDHTSTITNDSMHIHSSENAGSLGHDPFQSSRTAAPSSDHLMKSGGSSLLSRLNGLQLPHNSNDLRLFRVPPPPPSAAIDATPSTTTTNMIDDDDVMMGDSTGTDSNAAEAPGAPLRRKRTVRGTAPGAVADGHTYDDPTKSRIAEPRARVLFATDAPERPLTTDTDSLARAPSHNNKRTVSGHPAPTTLPTTASAAAAAAAAADGAPQRKSARLLNQFKPSSSRTTSSATSSISNFKDLRDIKKPKAPTTKVKAASTVGRVVSGNRKPPEKVDLGGAEKELRPASAGIVAQGVLARPQSAAAVSVASAQPAVDTEALQFLLALFLKLANGYQDLAHFRCLEAVQHFNTLDVSQRKTPWVLACLGRAHYERSAYHDAETAFTELRRLAPSRLDDLEVYTTVLWHLKADITLSFLARELLDLDPQSPQAWCAVGNAWSLERDHESAVKAFRRAVQLEPHFSYAHALRGHEHVETEEFDKALEAYRDAVRCEPRCWAGWYGFGKVHEKLGKWDAAEKYYGYALKINRGNVLLTTYMGVVLEKQRRPAAALGHYTRAVELDPSSAHARYKKARALLAIQRVAEAKAELDALKELAPDEANVHFLLGRLNKVLRNRTAAIRHFTIAMNLDPRAAQYIKEAMETIGDDDYDEADLIGDTSVTA